MNPVTALTSVVRPLEDTTLDAPFRSTMGSDRHMVVAGVGPARRTTLFRRLFLTYAGVVGLAVAVLVLAPITVSVPTALAELAVILVGFARDAAGLPRVPAARARAAADGSPT